MKTICVDFDGVIHSYTSRWQGVAVVADPPTPGAIRWLFDMVKIFDIQIYSSRSSQPEGIDAMRTWLLNHAIHELGSITAADYLLSKIKFPLDKPKPFLTIDDRAICFDGTWPSAETMSNFTPWNKK